MQSFLSYAAQPSGASILCFHILSFLKAPSREWLQTDGGWTAGILFFLGSLRAHQLPIMVSAIADDCDVLVYIYGRKYSLSRPLGLVFKMF